jgi:glycosyltransferase involved in cell wall biosynthesis
MAKKPLLSVAVVVQNQRDAVEATLTSLYELTDIPFELFIIDDGSTDGSGDAIESLLDYHQHEQTFFFQHSHPAGRGNSLNEAIQQCNGTLFWAPETIHEIDENELSKRLDQLADSTNLALIQKRELPSSHQQWLRLIPKANWPQDGDFIWNLPALSSANMFFNPYAERFHGMELAARLGDASYAISDKAWYKPSPFVDNRQPGFQQTDSVCTTLYR